MPGIVLVIPTTDLLALLVVDLFVRLASVDRVSGIGIQSRHIQMRHMHHIHHMHFTTRSEIVEIFCDDGEILGFDVTAYLKQVYESVEIDS